MEVIVGAQRTLWSTAGERARAYLHGRGLRDDILQQAQIGYVPGGPREWRKMCGLNVPCGIVIPWVIDGVPWSLKVRRAAGKPKYMQVKGGSPAGLYRVDLVEPWQDVIITEGEFDALCVAQTTRLVAAVALGSASNTVRDMWMGRLVRSPRIYARLDRDQSGEEAARRLAGLSARVRSVQVPEPHEDINDFMIADADRMGQWVRGLEAWITTQ